MPYCGRPSPGCQTCRQRKIKCDRAKPACENCVKSKWECPGYRDTVDLLFRDESSKVVHKAQAKQEESKIERSYPDGYCKSREDSREPKIESQDCRDRQAVRIHGLPELTPVPATLPCNLDELAIGFVFHYYAVNCGNVWNAWGPMESSNCLLASIVALGAAGVTKSGHGPVCSQQTQLRYFNGKLSVHWPFSTFQIDYEPKLLDLNTVYTKFAVAIRLTNNALCSPIDVTKDSTLLAINLLGSFECVTGLQRTLDSWHDHTHGAAALLQHRGAKQFETAEGGRLFMQTASSLVTSCLGRRFPIPAHIRTLTAMASEQIPNPDDKIWRGFCLNMRFADLYAKLLPNNMLRSSLEAESIIREALTLDRDMVALLNDFSDDWYCLKAPADGPMVFSGYIYAYPHVLTAQHYNSILSKRIIIQDIMLNALRSHPDPSSLHLSDQALQHIHNATLTILELQRDILASVPQFLGTSFWQFAVVSPFSTIPSGGWPRDNMWTNFTIRDQNPWRCRKMQYPSLPAIRSFCGYNIQWPLYIAGAADAADGEVRTWVINVLRHFGHSWGLQQAFLLANSLETCEGEQLNAHLELATSVKDSRISH